MVTPFSNVTVRASQSTSAALWLTSSLHGGPSPASSVADLSSIRCMSTRWYTAAQEPLSSAPAPPLDGNKWRMPAPVLTAVLGPPLLLVAVKVVGRHNLPSAPVAHDQVLELDRLALGDVNVPLLEPALAVGRARDGGANLERKVAALEDGNCSNSEMSAEVGRGGRASGVG